MVKRSYFFILTFIFAANMFGQGLDDGLVGKYYFSAGSIDDESGNEFDASFSSAVPTEDRFGNSNYAQSFDGSQHITVPYMNEFGGENMSVSLWFRSTSTEFARIIALPFSGSPSWCIGYYTPTTTSNGVDYYAGFDEPSPWTPYWTGISDVDPDGTWHFVTGIRDSISKKIFIYMDCQLSDSSTYLGHVYEPNEYLSIGRYDESFGQYFTGDIDDIRVYNRVLSTDEINQLCNESNPFLGIQENINELTLYPNPVSDKLILNVNDSHDASISVEITDLSGREVYKKPLTVDQIDVSELTTGIYIIRLKNKGGLISTNRFIKE